MNYIQLTEWGNKKSHLVSTSSISSFTFGGKYVEVRLSQGHTIIVTETRDEIEQMLLHLDSEIISAKIIKDNNPPHPGDCGIWTNCNEDWTATKTH
jgi:hypothetical protein